MLTKKQSLQYYLFSLANFLAAFGGGIILGKGIGVINSPFFQSGSVMAFFIGTVFGLVLLQLIPKKTVRIIWAMAFNKRGLYFAYSP